MIMMNIISPISPKLELKIRDLSVQYYSNLTSSESSNIESKVFRNSKPVFLPYQYKYAKTVLKSKNLVTIVEKSRRIGLSWADACLATVQAARSDGCNHFYIGYNHQMSEQYINDVAFWAKALNIVCSKIDVKVIDENDKSILAYRIKFLSGYQVIALSSRPNNLRSRKGNITIDECAFHQDFGEIVKSSLAAVVWGYNVRFISTHNGKDSKFNQLCNDVKAGKYKYNHLKIPFKIAVKNGLAKRVLEVQKKKYSKELEEEWVNSIYDIYGVSANEELDCIPSDYRGGGKVFNQEYFKYSTPVPGNDLFIVRFWDFASTPKEIRDNSYYTATTKVAYEYRTKKKYVLDSEAKQLDPSNVIEWIKEVAESDGYDTLIRWEEEPGSSGVYTTKFLKDELIGYDAEGIKPIKDKISRAKPVASETKRGEILLTDFPFSENFIKYCHQFDGSPQPKVNDLVDSFTGAIAYINSDIPLSMLFT